MITSRSLPLDTVLKLGRFEPAKVQREFQWETAHVDRLLSDLVSAFQRMGFDEFEIDDGLGGDDDAHADAPPQEHALEEDEEGARPATGVVRLPEPARQIPDAYFLGSIILFKASDKSRNHIVYDGLQRLTTLNILLSILRDTWSDIEETDLQSLRSLLFDDDERRLTFPTTGQSLSSIVSQRPLQRRDLTDGDFKMREAVDYFSDKFATGWSIARRKSFLAFLQDRVHVTVTETDNHSVAYQMFIGANTRGLRLDIGDVLKGMIADIVRAKGGTVEQINACAKGWRDAQLSLRGSFSDALHALEMFKFRPPPPDAGQPAKAIPRHVTGEKLQEYFGASAMTPKMMQDWIEGEFNEIIRIFERARDHNAKEHASGVDICYRQLSFLGWTEWQPLLIAICVELGTGTRAANAKIRDLCRACYLVEIFEWSEWTRRKKFMMAVAQLEDDKDPFWKGGALAFGKKAQNAASRKLRAALTQAERRGTILRWIETLHWGRRVPRTATNSASVEHVLPLAAIGEWSKLFTEDEQEKLTHTLGNLCILDRKANERVGNKDWPAKRGEYESHKNTFKTVAGVLAASEAAVSADKAKPWSAAAIQNRTHQLASLAEKALLIA